MPRRSDVHSREFDRVAVTDAPEMLGLKAVMAAVSRGILKQSSSSRKIVKLRWYGFS
jgi:hypothetical protein